MAIDKTKTRPPNDIQLMTDFARGELSELGQLYLRHRDRTLALAYRILGNRSRAEDISQEAFLRVYRAVGKYKPEAEFTTWLYKIVINLCIDEKRRICRSKNMIDAYEYLLMNAQNKFDENRSAEISEAVNKAISKLSRRQRTAVTLHKIQGLSHAEIEKRTGWSQSSIESLLVRAYRKLRKELISIYEFL